jgi:Concanavalin A-like lectin/glucanases superfamily
MKKSFTFLLSLTCLSLTAFSQNTALDLTGANYVTTNGPDVINNSGDFTIEFWTFVPVAGFDHNPHQFMAQGYPGSAFYVGYDATGTIVVGDNWGSTGIPMPFGTWTHIALTFDNNTSLASLYINGTLANASDFGFSDFYPFRIGNALDNTQSVTGEIDEIKAWNTVRTPAQVRSDLFGIPNLSDNTLVAYYQMNDGSGTNVTNSATTNGSSENGTITGDNGSNSWATSPISYNSNALTFDGIDDQVQIPTSSAYDFNTGTVEFWANATSLNSNFATLLANRGSGVVRYSFHLSATQIGIDNGSGTVNALNLPDTFAIINMWHHLAFANDGANTYVYINGNLLGTIPGAFGTANGQLLTLGNSNNNGTGETAFSGSLDEVRLWNSTRSAVDILANMNNTITDGTPSLVGQFSFDEGVPASDNTGLTTTLDNTAAANNGLLQNFTLNGATSNFNSHALTPISLPLSLTMFTANRDGDQVLLQWETAQEENTRDFSVERSTDGNTYAAIGTVDAAGNSSTPRDYSFNDLQPAPTNYYRLKAADENGQFTYSNIRVVNFPATNGLIWYGTGRHSAEVILQQGNTELYNVTDATGRLLRSGQLVGGKTEISGLPAGIYFVKVGALVTKIVL